MIALIKPPPEELPCPLCELEAQFDWLEHQQQQQPKSRTAGLRALMWACIVALAISLGCAWYTANAVAYLFCCSSCVFALLVGNTSGRLSAAKELEE
jgi:hypothetical protein